MLEQHTPFLNTFQYQKEWGAVKNKFRKTISFIFSKCQGNKWKMELIIVN